MDIRFSQTSDFDSWMSLLFIVQESFPGLDFEEYRKELRQIVGALAFSAETGEIEFLAVHPAYRRLGAAKALVMHMLGLFSSGRTVSVITYRDGDPMGEAARAFYSRLGFTQGRLLTVFDYPCQEFIHET